MKTLSCQECVLFRDNVRDNGGSRTREVPMELESDQHKLLPGNSSEIFLSLFSLCRSSPNLVVGEGCQKNLEQANVDICVQ